MLSAKQLKVIESPAYKLRQNVLNMYQILKLMWFFGYESYNFLMENLVLLFIT